MTMTQRTQFIIAFSSLFTALGLGVVLWQKFSEPRSSDRYTPRPKGSVTFAKDIAPIVFNQCAECHRPGQAGPFSLLSYPDVRKRAKQIAEVTGRRYMPPWLPEPGYGEFANTRVLTPEQIGLIQQWAEEGAAEGNPADLPALPQWSGDWQLGPPDLIVTMPESYTLAAEGKDVYRNFVAPIPLTARRYVKAVEFRPGNSKIVHHALLRFDRTRESRQWDARDPGPGFDGIHAPATAQAPAGHFMSWQPGKRVALGPEGLPWRLETNTDLVVQTHMQPTGKPEEIQSSVGFYFTDQPPTNTPIKIWLTSYAIDIPAGETNYVLKDSYVLPVDAQVIGVLPHAHYLGKELQGYAILPSGARQWLLRINNWDFNWQGDYRYAKPVFLPKGTTIAMEFHYDNSTNNIRNPSQPPQRVRYGLQSTDEMGELWFQVLARNANDLSVITRDSNERLVRDGIAYNEYLLGHNPRDAAAHNSLGRLQLIRRQPAEAATHFRTALAIQPDFAEPHYYLGLLFRQQNKLVEARAEFESALRFDPSHTKAHGNLGTILAEQGDLQSAEAHFRTALRLDPEDTIARDALAELLRARAARGK